MTVGCGAGTKPVKKPASKTKAVVAAAEESNSDNEEVEKAEPTQWQLAKTKAAAQKAAAKKKDSDSDGEDIENTVPKKQSVAKAKPAAKPTRGDFILHFVTLTLLGVVSVAAAKAAAQKTAAKKKDSDSDSDEELVPKTLCDCISNLSLHHF